MGLTGLPSGFFFLIIFILILAAAAIKILREYERGVIFRLGRLIGAKGPGIIFIIPGVDKLLRISLRLLTLDIPPQDVITRDNISIKVNAVVYFRVMDPNKAVVEVENYLYATSQLAQTTLRSVVGQADLDELLSQRDKINLKLQDILDKHTRTVGNQGLSGGNQTGRSTGEYAEGHCKTGRSRKGEESQNHPCRG